MHPMFVKLFIETDADDLALEEDWRRRAHRSRRAQPTMVTATAPAHRSGRHRRARADECMPCVTSARRSPMARWC
jgi:hypothetical protein